VSQSGCGRFLPRGRKCDMRRKYGWYLEKPRVIEYHFNSILPSILNILDMIGEVKEICIF
jgi:hypothetical protein